MLLEKWSQEPMKMKLLKTMHSKCVTVYLVDYFKVQVLMFLSLCRALTFVYPYGATLSVIKPAVAVLSTGSVCFPLNRPVLAFHQGMVRCTFSYSFPDHVLVDTCETMLMEILFHIGDWQTGRVGLLSHVQ